MLGATRAGARALPRAGPGRAYTRFRLLSHSSRPPRPPAGPRAAARPPRSLPPRSRRAAPRPARAPGPCRSQRLPARHSPGQHSPPPARARARSLIRRARAGAAAAPPLPAPRAAAPPAPAARPTGARRLLPHSLQPPKHALWLYCSGGARPRRGRARAGCRRYLEGGAARRWRFPRRNKAPVIGRPARACTGLVPRMIGGAPAGPGAPRQGPRAPRPCSSDPQPRAARGPPADSRASGCFH